MTEQPRKTYKRELAGLLLLIMFGFYIGGIWLEKAFEIAESLKLEVFILVGGAFGMDSYAKQVRK